MAVPKKNAFPVERVRRFLEPGPVVLLSTAWKGERAIMTLGWHMMLRYDLVGTYIWQANHSHDLARRSRQCVINLPTEAPARHGGADRQLQQPRRRQVRAVRADRGTGPGGGRADGRRLPRQLRMPPARNPHHRRIPAVRLARGPRPRGGAATLAGDAALPGRRPLHGRRARAFEAAPVPAGHAGAVTAGLSAPGPASRRCARDLRAPRR